MKTISQLLKEVEMCTDRTVDPWTQSEAIDFCKKIEAICIKYGCHVALTGGTLYGDGPRKDCDILFY